VTAAGYDCTALIAAAHLGHGGVVRQPVDGGRIAGRAVTTSS